MLIDKTRLCFTFIHSHIPHQSSIHHPEGSKDRRIETKEDTGEQRDRFVGQTHKQLETNRAISSSLVVSTLVSVKLSGSPSTPLLGFPPPCSIFNRGQTTKQQATTTTTKYKQNKQTSTLFSRLPCFVLVA